MTSPVSTAVGDRRPDLDWIRVGAFFLLILYHVGMYYVPWGWHVKTAHPVEALEPFMFLTNPWRLTLLFLVSGAATRFMADKMSAGALTRARVARLLPPLVLAIVLIVPPQTYFQLIEAGQVMTFTDFYRHYITASGHWRIDGAPLITPTYNHMWFVAYLFVYTMILGLVLAVAGGPLRRFGDWVAARLGTWGLLIAPFLWLAIARLLLERTFGETHALIDDWYVHAVSFGAFLFGFLIARSDTIRQTFIRLRKPAAVGAAITYVAWAAYAWIYRGDDPIPPLGLRAAMVAVYAADQWLWIAAILGFGAKYLTKGGPVLTYLTLAVFPFYLVHQTIIVVAAHTLAGAHLPQGVEALVLIATTFAGCFATYEIVRRVNVLRPWFGLKALPKTVRAPVGMTLAEDVQ
ncbi:MAG: acetyltransferase [Caulobacter sp.]|nr:acetyltransferase [Caulobacter sp.]